MTLRGASLALLVAVLAACNTVGQDPGGECSYGGGVHPAGTTFPAGDGCNSCSCDANGEVACTKAICDWPFCTYGGRTYDAGETFPSTDGCNACACDANGNVACDARACPIDPGPTCMLDASYEFGPNGGIGAYLQRAALTSDGRFSYTQTKVGSTITELPASCDPALPPCGTPSAIDLADVMTDVADVDVRAGFAAATPPIYGHDSRPADGQVFEIKRATGDSLLVGDPCPASSSSCRPIPAGVAKLADDLRTLMKQQLADPSCSFARP